MKSEKRKVAHDIMLQLLGIGKSKKSSVASIKNVILRDLSLSVSDYSLLYSRSPFSTPSRIILGRVYKSCVRVLISDIGYGKRKLCAEVNIGSKGKLGYSRNPLEPVNQRYVGDIELAIVTYLTRGYSHFFQSESEMDFDAAKIALNDFHQAYNLAWRLYRSLPSCHSQSSSGNAEEYLTTVLKHASTKYFPARKSPSAYFVWSALLLCEIFRGNIYRHLGYLEQADRHYRHAEDRFNRLHAHSLKKNHDAGLFGQKIAMFFGTRTFIRAMYERSKVKFDLGQFLESLISHISCTELLVYLYRSETPGRSKHIRELLIKLKSINSYLDTERCMPMFNRSQLHLRFGNRSKSVRQRVAENAVLNRGDLKELVKIIPSDMRNFCVRVLARVGFVLFTIRPKQEGLEAIDRQWINSFFRVDEIWKNFDQTIFPSALGQYCETFFGETTTDPSAFSDNVERRYSLLLRSAIQGSPSAQDSRVREKSNQNDSLSTETRFYERILQKSTENIGNIVTIPHNKRDILMRRGYKYRVTQGDIGKMRRGKTSEICKFVVLRRWQSYSPKIPKQGQKRYPGGGYLFLWKGKGIAIDPGYDFIQNIYDEGFSLEDIDAVIATHSHPDHDDDLSTLTTLVKEWNEYHYEIGAKERVKRLDIFLNESCERKFSAWLQASKVNIGRVIPLPVVCWNKDTKKATDGPFRGVNASINLCSKKIANDSDFGYNMILEVVPAWHDDVIGKTSAVGLKFHLYDENGTKKFGTVGYTGDTGAYGLEVIRSSEKPNVIRIDDMYKDCELLVAHLGDIRLRELSSIMRHNKRELVDPDGVDPLAALTRSWLAKEPLDTSKSSSGGKEVPSVKRRLKDLFNFMISLKLLPSGALKVKLPVEKVNDMPRVQEWLGAYFLNGNEGSQPHEFNDNHKGDVLNILFNSFLKSRSITDSKLLDNIRSQINAAYERVDNLKLVGRDRQAYLLIEYLAGCSLSHWRYPYHLGVFGLFRLYEANATYRLKKGKNKISRNTRVFVVGELPEELANYRHRVAYLLDRAGDELNPGRKRQAICALTGDIGLHIKLKVTTNELSPLVRCTYCNYNNELVSWGDSYHKPSDMVETQASRQGGAMIYLCKHHYPGRFKTEDNPTLPEFFLNRPDLRVV